MPTLEKPRPSGRGDVTRQMKYTHTRQGSAEAQQHRGGADHAAWHDGKAIGRGQGRAVSVPPLPSSTVATWGPEDLGEQLSKWQVESVTEFEPSARPTRSRPANARRKG